MENFWQQLPRPFTVLAPLDGITDFVFRQIMTEIGKPDVLFTEFTSCDGLVSEGHKRVEQKLLFQSNEHPVVAQIWGTKPENFYKAAQYIKEAGFSGIDINMGCPDRTVIKYGACSGLIRNHQLAAEIIKATKEGAQDLPVSVKTRIGFEKINVEEWIGFLLQQKLDALTIHLRTVRELSKVSAHWEYMSEIIKMKNTFSPATIIIGNGDIVSVAEVYEKYKKYGGDGFMIGRGVFANPWVFNTSLTIHEISEKQRFGTYLHHIKFFEKIWGTEKNFANLKKFCKAYINNFPDAGTYRENIMEVKTLKELKEIVSMYQQKFI